MFLNFASNNFSYFLINNALILPPPLWGIELCPAGAPSPLGEGDSYRKYILPALPMYNYLLNITYFFFMILLYFYNFHPWFI
jgi:hypothetical protein